MTNKEALIKSYHLLSPYSDNKCWEFDSNLTHLNFITKYVDKKANIFDAGCGLGILALSLKLLNYNIQGADKYIFKSGSDFYVENDIKNIWQKYNLKIVPIDIMIDPINKKYDLIVSIATIEHQKNPKVFLQKLKNNINNNGLLYLATPNQAHLLNRIRVLFGLSVFSSLKTFFDTGDKFIGHWREYTINELKDMYEWLGFEIVFAKTIQDTKPKFKSFNIRHIYVNLFRLLSYLLPNSGAANIIIGKNKK